MKFGRLKAASDEMLHLDLIRFIASAGIVWHHSHEFLFAPDIRTAAMVRSGGLALLVDLFFFISGVVIATVYATRVDTGESILRFWQRRIGRLIPVHWLALACTILVWVVLLQFADGRTTPSFEPHCIAANALLLSSLFNICGAYQFNGVTWSISAELVMYALFPLIAVGLARWKLGPLLLGLAVAALNLFLLRDPLTGAFDSWTNLHPVLRALPAFLIGCSVAAIRLPRIPSQSLVVSVLTAIMLACMTQNAPSWLSLLMVYVVGLCAVSADRSGLASPSVRTLAPLGQLTYSLYMWHSIFILVIINALGDKLLNAGFGLMLALTLLCYAALAVWSYISFEYIETPARRWIDSLFRGSRRLHCLDAPEKS